jgi:hypothetical protein
MHYLGSFPHYFLLDRVSIDHGGQSPNQLTDKLQRWRADDAAERSDLISSPIAFIHLRNCGIAMKFGPKFSGRRHHPALYWHASVEAYTCMFQNASH